jgi:hypothetical protein
VGGKPLEKPLCNKCNDQMLTSLSKEGEESDETIVQLFDKNENIFLV